MIAACETKGSVFPHALLVGPPGIGRTSLAHIIARELGVSLHTILAPRIDGSSARRERVAADAGGDWRRVSARARQRAIRKAHDEPNQMLKALQLPEFIHEQPAVSDCRAHLQSPAHPGSRLQLAVNREAQGLARTHRESDRGAVPQAPRACRGELSSLRRAGETPGLFREDKPW